MSRQGSVVPDAGDSSSDVSLTSTLPSDSEEEYDVEKIVAEVESEEGKRWLVKWVGYGHERNTWEPISSFNSGESIADWNRLKNDIAKGRLPPFDVEVWSASVAAHAEARRKRKRKRRAKRRAILRAAGHPAESSSEESEDDEEDEQGSEDGEAMSLDGYQSGDSLMHELSGRPRKVRPDAGVGSSTQRPPIQRSRPAPVVERQSASTSAGRGLVSLPPRQQIPKPATIPEMAAVYRQNAVTKEARPVAKTARRTQPPAVLVNQRPKKTAGLKRNRESDDDDQVQSKPTSDRSWRDIYQQLRAPNRDPAPDLAALDFIDPSTGKVDHSVRAGFQQEKRLQEGDTGDTAHPPDNGGPSDANLNTEATRYGGQPINARPNADDSVIDPHEAAITFAETGKLPYTCFNWTQPHGCPRTARDCPYLHKLTGTIVPPNTGTQRYPDKFKSPPLTCWFWYRDSPRGCARPDAECNYAHWNTGWLAVPNHPPDRISVPGRAMPESANARVKHVSETSNGKSSNKKDFECAYWKYDKCWRSEDKCWFAHHPTGSTGPVPKALAAKAAKLSHISSVPANHQNSRSQDWSRYSGPVAKSPSIDQSSLSAQNVLPSAADSSFPNKTGPSKTTESPTVGPVKGAIKMRLRIPGDNEAYTILRFQVSGFAPKTQVFLNGLGGGNNELDLSVSAFCLAKDYEAYARADPESSDIGNIQPEESTTALNDFASHLKLHDGGATVLHEAFTAVIYPAGHESWSFLKNMAHNGSGAALLRMHVSGPIAKVASMNTAPAVVQGDSIARAIRDLLGIDPEHLFKPPLGGGRIWPRVFLMFDPQAHAQEIELLGKVFHDFGAGIYHPGIPGSWKMFREGRSGVLLLHPEVSSYHQSFAQFDGFREVVKGRYNIFEVGCDTQTEEGRSGYTFKPLFTKGTVYFITDDVLEHEAGKTWPMLENYHKIIDFYRLKHPQFVDNYKMAARPDLSRWLLQLIDEYYAEFEAGNQDRMRLFKQSNPVVGEQDLNPLEVAGAAPAHTTIIPISINQSVKNHSESYKSNPRQATDALVDDFATWACRNAHRFKLFKVVTPAGEPAEWRTKYPHLDFTTIDACAEFFANKVDSGTKAANAAASTAAVQDPR